MEPRSKAFYHSDGATPPTSPLSEHLGPLWPDCAAFSPPGVGIIGRVSGYGVQPHGSEAEAGALDNALAMAAWLYAGIS